MEHTKGGWTRVGVVRWACPATSRRRSSILDNSVPSVRNVGYLLFNPDGNVANRVFVVVSTEVEVLVRERVPAQDLITHKRLYTR